MNSVDVQEHWLLNFFAPWDASILLDLEKQASTNLECSTQCGSSGQEYPTENYVEKKQENSTKTSGELPLSKRFKDGAEYNHKASAGTHPGAVQTMGGRINVYSCGKRQGLHTSSGTQLTEKNISLESTSKDAVRLNNNSLQQIGPRRKFICTSKFMEPWVMQYEAILADLKQKNFEIIVTESGMYRCSLCKLEFKKSTACNTHAEKVHSSKQYHCDCCGGKFNAAYLLRKHLGISAPSPPSTANTNQSPPNKPAKKTKKRKLFTCHSSDPEPWVTQSQAIVAELRVKNFRGIITPDNKYMCSLCGMQFDTRFSCSRHAGRVHSTIRFHCDSCDATFTNATSLRKHLQSDTNDTVEVKGLLSSESDHLSNMSMDDIEKPWISQHRAILAELKKTDFKLIITPEGKFRCSLCDGEYGTSTACNKHAVEMHSSRCFSCEMCGSKFARAYNLQVHIEEAQCQGRTEKENTN